MSKNLEHSFRVVCRDSLVATGGATLSVELLLASISHVNAKFREMKERTRALALNAFEVLDFRMLSGLVGEMLIAELSARAPGLRKNPNIDGYPDLLQVSTPEMAAEFDFCAARRSRSFIDWEYGGIEVKNTFGTKRSGVQLLPGHSRIHRINAKLDWKAHHRNTNNLLGLLSDYVDGCPRIVAAMFSRDLTEEDWSVKQQPRVGSTMTSFSVIQKSGSDKLRSGLRLCLDQEPYTRFFGVGVVQ